MALDDDAAQPQQGGAIITTVIDAVSQTVQHRRGQQAGSQGQGIALEFGTHHGGDHLGNPLDGLEHDIAYKTIANDDINSTLADIVALDVAIKVQTAVAQQFGRLFDDFITLDDFFADVEQAYGG